MESSSTELRPKSSTDPPFNELWLLSRCLQDGEPAWYALSHIVGRGGDVVTGRETFGYPSKTGTVRCTMEADRFAVSAARLGREVLRCSGTVVRRPTRQGVAPRLDDQFEIIGLRPHPPYREMTLHGFVEPGPQLELIAQAWSVDLIGVQLGDPSAIALELPSAPGPGVIGAPDPWYEFAAGEIVQAALAISGEAEHTFQIED